MQLPNADEAIVARDKLENYVLDLAHPIGGGKARFFLSFWLPARRMASAG
jgi:hypothetical protein